MKRNYFTLIEMLVVIGLIAILAGLAFPALNSARRKAKENAAVAGCNTLATAIKQFHMTYSRYPYIRLTGDVPITYEFTDKDTLSGEIYYLPKGGKHGGERYSSGHVCKTADFKDYKDIISVLVGVNDSGNEFGGSDNWKKYNPRKIRFLEPPAEYIQGKGFVNPWGEYYYVIWNASGSNMLRMVRPSNGFLPKDTKLANTTTILSDIAVFSELDPNTTDYQTGKRLATSWGGIKTF